MQNVTSSPGARHSLPEERQPEDLPPEERLAKELLPEAPGKQPLGATGAARFSSCGGYRWWLGRWWCPRRPGLLFIGLNPSRADGQRDDPTLRRLARFARDWGYGGLEVVNLFSAVTPSPRLLRGLPDPVGVGTDGWIRQRAKAKRLEAIWLGWGNQGGWGQRDLQVLDLLRTAVPGKPLLALGATRQGQPRHPLYAPASLPRQPWQPWQPRQPWQPGLPAPL